MSRPDVRFQPRVDSDIDSLLNFVERQPWGNRTAREKEIRNTIQALAHGPLHDDVGVRRRDSGLELRRRNVAQFVIIYAYYAPSLENPDGLVSIRAVRHSRIKHVFRGVRETPEPGAIGTIFRLRNSVPPR